jgi:hypothetical protein
MPPAERPKRIPPLKGNIKSIKLSILNNAKDPRKNHIRWLKDRNLEITNLRFKRRIYFEWFCGENISPIRGCICMHMVPNYVEIIAFHHWIDS